MNGVTIYWGKHLEYNTHLSMYIDPTEDYIECTILTHFVSTIGSTGCPFIVLIDGVPFDWNLVGAQ